MTLNKPIDTITEEDLQALISEPVAEGKTIDYKQALPDNTRGSKREFLADVTSFANAAGGHLVFGMKERGGIPIELSGLDIENIEAECLRLENLIRDCVEPRLPSLAIRAVPLESSKTSIVIFIPRSWTPPHVVNYEKHWRFYSRNSSGKYPLDVSEVRSAVTLSETLVQRIRSFRDDRIAHIIMKESPITLVGGSSLVLHLLPLNSFEPATNYDVKSLVDKGSRLNPVGTTYHEHRYNFDGLLTYSDSSQPLQYRSYLQVFRNGCIEAVSTKFFGQVYDGLPRIEITAMERAVIDAIPRYLDLQKELGASPPIFIAFSLLNVRGLAVIVSRQRYFIDEEWPIEKRDLLIPEIMIENFECDAAEVMRYAFDTIWNASGWPRSMNYDEDGRRAQR